MTSNFEDGANVVILYEDDFNKLVDASKIGDDINVNDVIEENKKLKQQLSDLNDIPQRVKLIKDYEAKLNKLYETHKKDIQDKDDEIKLSDDFSKLCLFVLGDAMGRGAFDRLKNTKPHGYYELIDMDKYKELSNNTIDNVIDD